MGRMPEERLPRIPLKWTVDTYPWQKIERASQVLKVLIKVLANSCVREDASLFTGRDDIKVEDMLGFPIRL